MPQQFSRRDWLKHTGLALAAAGLAPASGFAKDDFNNWYNLPEGGIAQSRVLMPAPASIVSNGRLNLGVFKTPVRNLNITDAALFRKGFKGPMRRMRMQQFIGCGVVNSDWHIGIIIIDLQIAAQASFYALNRHTKQCFQHELYGTHEKIRLAPSVWDGLSYARKPGFNMEFKHHVEQGFHKLTIEIAENKNKPAVKFDVKYYEDLSKVQPLVASMPVEPRHYFYTHKVTMPVEGEMVIGDQKAEFKPTRDSGNMDEHRNYYPFPNRWLFGCCNGFDERGRLVGVNMCDNIIKDQKHWNENCLWVGDKISLLGPIRFEFDPKDPMKPWRMREENGRLELELTPDGGGAPNVIKPAGFSYYQKNGPYNGFAMDDAGEKHIIRNFFGEAEDFKLGYY
jgi:hypothetical protein